MIVATCQHENAVRCGKDRKGSQRYKCNECGKYFVPAGPLGTMRTSLKDAATVIGLAGRGYVRSALSSESPAFTAIRSII